MRVKSERAIPRESNIELLRVLCMLLITAHHYGVYGGFEPVTSLSANALVMSLLLFGGKFGVNCFILISGYFLVNSRFKLSRLIKLMVQMMFYSCAGYLVLLALGYVSFSLSSFVKALLPFVYTGWWFATGYIVLYSLSPFINKLILNLSKRGFLLLIAFLLLIWCVVPSITLGDISFSTLGWFITLYLIGAFIRLYPHKLFERCGLNALAALCCFVLIILSYIVILSLSSRFAILSGHSDFFMGMNKLPMVLCCVFAFIAFTRLKMPRSRIINNIAQTTFGIYLFHEYAPLRPVLWKTLFNNSAHFASPLFFAHALIAVIIVFTAGYLIERIRIPLESLIFNGTVVTRLDGIPQRLLGEDKG